MMGNFATETQMTGAAHGRDRESELHWLALHLVPGLGCRRAVQLLYKLGAPETIFRASVSELETAGLSGAIARSINSGCTFDDAVEQQRLMDAAGVELVTLHDRRYPEQLRQIFDAPLLLFARGNTGLMDQPCIGVVGTRRPSQYGLAAATKLTTGICQAQLVATSGMARGIDTAAHKAALAVNARTIAVLGCGVDQVYPAENRELAAQLAREALLLSEFPMRTPAYPQNFPLRNRIVSGLSLGVLVVEGSMHSGSGITARTALEQGRHVFAVPGNITSKQSWGPNLLIRQGAALIMESQDIFSELTSEERLEVERKIGRQRLLVEQNEELSEKPSRLEPRLAAMPEEPANEARSRLLNKLTFDNPCHLDELMEVLDGVSVSELIAMLFELEVEGTVRRLPGKSYIKVWA
jgi:DNA processing protein